MFPVVEFGSCYWLKWGQVPVSSVLSGASSLWVTAFAAQIREHARNKQYLSQNEAGSGSEPGACPAFLNPPAFRLQGCELVASAHWGWPRRCVLTRYLLVFQTLSLLVVWNKTMDFAKVGVR